MANEEELETRLAEVMDLRVEEAGRKQKIVGTAVVYDQISKRMSFGREIIKPGAFTESLKRGDEVRALVNHRGDQILGRRSKGTLKITDTKSGLHVEIDPPDTQVGRDIMESIKRGDASEMSFAFRTKPGIDDGWEPREGEMVRIVNSGRLVDVSVVTEEAAYSQTQVGIAMRSLEAWKAVQPKLPSIAALRQRLELGALD